MNFLIVRLFYGTRGMRSLTCIAGQENPFDGVNRLHSSTRQMYVPVRMTGELGRNTLANLVELTKPTKSLEVSYRID